MQSGDETQCTRPALPLMGFHMVRSYGILNGYEDTSLAEVEFNRVFSRKRVNLGTTRALLRDVKAWDKIPVFA